MSLCRGCGASIEWIRTTAGRSIPVDPEPVFIATDEGEVVGVRRGLCALLEKVPGGGQISQEIERGLKMTTLEVKEMCHECPNFNAVSETYVLYGDGEIAVVDSVVTCASRSMCKHIRRYLKNTDEDKKKASDA